MTLSRVRLELARDPEFPDGSTQHGYEFVAPIDNEGHIDAETWRANRKRCRVRRFWEGGPDEHGHLVRTRSGDWAFHYDISGDPNEDEPGYRFGSHLFKPDEYVSIHEQDGTMRTFKVVSTATIVVP